MNQKKTYKPGFTICQCREPMDGQDNEYNLSVLFRDCIQKAINKTNTVEEAAEVLGICDRSLYRALKVYSIRAKVYDYREDRLLKLKEYLKEIRFEFENLQDCIVINKFTIKRKDRHGYHVYSLNKKIHNNLSLQNLKDLIPNLKQV